MPLVLSLMREEDIPAFVAVDAAAMEHWGLARAMETSNTSGEPREKFVEQWTRASFKQDSSQAWVKVTDTDTDEMVAAAFWRFQLEEAKPGRRPGAREEAEAAKQSEKPVGVMLEMRRLGEEFNNKFIGNQPHAWLSILATHPKHQRKGAGSTLVAWGCAKADEHGIISGVQASAAGLSLYQKHGFEVRSEVELDLRPYGVDETELRRGMIRPA